MNNVNKFNFSRNSLYKMILAIFIIVLGICICYIAWATYNHNINYFYGKITYEKLKIIDNDNVLLLGLTDCVTNKTLSEKGYIISSEQSLGEAKNSVWYDCKRMNEESFLEFQNFSIELSDNYDLLGYNFYYKPISIENEALRTIISIYCDIANVDKFDASSGERFSYDEITELPFAEFSENGSVFKIIKTSSNQSIALFLEINNVGEVFFYGYCGMNNPEKSIQSGDVL